MAYSKNTNQTLLASPKNVYSQNTATTVMGNVDSIEEIGIPHHEFDDSLVIQGITSKTITTTFGREEDYIELHVRNIVGQLIYSETNFEDYTLNSTRNHITITPEQILKDRGFEHGEYTLKLHIHRNKIFTSSHFPFQIKEISTSRREIKSIAKDVLNNLFDDAIVTFISEIESASYFKEFLLNFGEGILIPGINILLNRDSLKYELILKTLNTLPADINKDTPFKIVEEISDPITVDVNLGARPLIDDSIELMGPNFQIDTRQNNSIPSAFKTYNDILNYSITSSYNHLLNKLENPDTINVQYDFVRNVSSSMEEIDRSYHFENFTHFSSAVERLKNFNSKLKQIELYDSQITSTNLIQGSITSSNTILNIKDDIETKRRNIIKGFDGYEHFLYFTSGSDYTWPKSTQSTPYKLYSITSSTAITWLGDALGTTPTYSGQLESASIYDQHNPHNLAKFIPTHIGDNSDNDLYVSFINMVGQHFDNIWAHIKHITEIPNLDNKFGISKELVYFQLKSLGIDTFDQFENSNLIEYILGEGLYGNAVENGLIIGNWVVGSNNYNFYNIERGTTSYVTASNAGSIPKGQITKEIWKRLYNNSPYLLKTKGTERGLRALMNCYGVPSTMLHVKEYGGNTVVSGPLKDLDTSDVYKTFSYDKSGLALKGLAKENGFSISTAWSGSLTNNGDYSKTIEFRVKPKRDKDDAHQHLFALSGSVTLAQPQLRLTTYTSNDISASNDASQHGQIDLIIDNAIKASTEPFPIYNGEFWNIFIGIDNQPTTSDYSDLKFGAYQANWLKHVSAYTSSFNMHEDQKKFSFGTGSNSGADTVYFGGMPNANHVSYDLTDGLGFSGSIQEIKYHYGELLSHETLKKHALEPFAYNGNTPSSSLETVLLRLPLGSNDQENSGSFHPHIEKNYLEFSGVNYSTIGNGFIIEDYNRRILSNLFSQEWEEVIETHHLPTPDTVGASMTSEKVRIDTGTIISTGVQDVLLVDHKSETSTLDRQPLDYEDLGIHFSPSFEINEDILYTLGPFRMDDYIGNPLPSAQTASKYEDLTDISNVYTKKLRGRYNYWDYIKLIQDYDHTLFKIIENFVPFKANTKTGLLIEPTFLERDKFAREVPIRSDGQTMTTGSHQTFEAHFQTYNLGNKVFSFATSSNASSIKGQFEPGSYVVSNNNLTDVTESKYSERIEQGTNATIEIYEEYLNPFRRLRNYIGALHANNSQFCQAPIRPINQSRSRNHYGIGAAVIGGSFVVGEWYNHGGGNPVGIGFSSIEGGFIIEAYQQGIMTQPGIGNTAIGSSFIVGFTQNVNPKDPTHYKTHTSNIILGNVMTGRKSKKYFKYQSYSI